MTCALFARFQSGHGPAGGRTRPRNPEWEREGERFAHEGFGTRSRHNSLSRTLLVRGSVHTREGGTVVFGIATSRRFNSRGYFIPLAAGNAQSSHCLQRWYTALRRPLKTLGFRRVWTAGSTGRSSGTMFYWKRLGRRTFPSFPFAFFPVYVRREVYMQRRNKTNVIHDLSLDMKIRNGEC